MKTIFSTAALIFLSFACTFDTAKVEVINIKGSDTMRIVVERLAQQYMKQNKGVSIYVEGGGTAKGAEALALGIVDICTASRTLNADESKMLADNFAAIGMSFLVAKDALSVYLNPLNPVNDINLSQLKAVFLCTVTNWKHAGGVDLPIEPVIRTPNSGTRVYFKNHVLNGEDYCSDVLVKSSMEGIIKEIFQEEGAIGFGGISLGRELKHCKINGIAPNAENVRNDTYPLIRYLYFYTVNTPKGELKRFIDWTLSAEGQNIVKNTGYIPIWELSF